MQKCALEMAKKSIYTKGGYLTTLRPYLGNKQDVELSTRLISLFLLAITSLLS